MAALVLVALAACVPKTRTVERDLRDFFPAGGAVEGWSKSGDLELYGSETLFDLVNGQADAFFAYGFEQVAVQNYQTTAGDTLRVYVWQLAMPASAYGLFTSNVAGQPVDVGNDGDADPGLRIIFWQDRYFAQVFAFRPVDDAVLTAFAGQVSNTLTASGAPPDGSDRPALVDRLPPGHSNLLFFHQEISAMAYVWLGGENLLGLSQETAGVLASYEVDGEPAYLMVIEYPNADAAAAGLQALHSGQIDEVIVADANGTLLGTVFGQGEASRVQDLLSSALQSK
ncbi:MAG: hypothetical protein JW934_19710 [Anaerolineae bacterium]|nr:hypothetical protein [Anaerolineae bacterium]